MCAGVQPAVGGDVIISRDECPGARSRGTGMKRIALVVILTAVTAGACGASGGGALGAATQPPAATDQPVDLTTDEPVLEPDPTTAVVIPKKFETLNKRGWQRVIKSPDDFTGRGFKLVACIFQFDAATGDDSFLANTSWHKETYWALNGENAAFSGTKKQLNPFVEGDIVSMNAVSLGSYSYDTQVGGNTTVPAFQVVSIKAEKGDCS
jgi:hypothetical protein